jgi:tetratricopeptide (TPR) repeat protein
MIRAFRVPCLACTTGGLVALLVSVLPIAPMAWQSQTTCSGPTCRLSIEEALTTVAQVSERKQNFVQAVRQLIVALAGTFGDEGERIRTTVESMHAALDAWDGAIRALESRVRQAAHPAEVHLALGAVYLDRHLPDQALREFAEASRLDPRRADAHAYQALAHTLSSNPAASAAALAKAISIDAGRPAIIYSMARQLALARQDAEAAAALHTFIASLHSRSLNRPVTTAAGSPFERVGLLRQTPGVAPIFPPALYADAFAHLARGAYKEAVGLIREAVDRDPLATTTERDRLGPGSAALRTGNAALAVEHLKAAVAAEPDRAEAHRLLAVALREADQQDHSIEEFRTAVELNPDDERSRIALADLYGTAGRDAEAERTLQETIARLPGSGQAFYSLGRLYPRMAKSLEAARALERAAERNPLVGHDGLYDAIGTIYLAEGDLDKASDAFQARADVSPNNAEAHRKLGEVLVQRNRHDQALGEFMAALLVDPGNVPAYVGIGQLHLQQGKYVEAADASQRAVDLDPAHHAARYTLGAALLRLGRKAEGQAQLQVFERMQAENRTREDREWELKLIRQSASTNLDKGDYEQVANDLRKVIPYTPDDANAYISLGVVLKRLGRHAEAIENFQKALELKAGADVHRLLAESYEQLGRREESRGHRETYDRARQDRLRALGGVR